MTSKAEERKALEKIKEIVEQVGGDDSYIGMAFEGCFEMAESNIVNDFGDSWQSRWRSAQQRAETLAEKYKKDVEQLTADKEQLLNEIDNLETEMESEVMDARDMVRDLRRELEDATESIKKGIEVNAKNLARIDDLETENDKLKQEVLVLKAKLYDLLIAEK